jgi:hypothetical protein
MQPGYPGQDPYSQNPYGQPQQPNTPQYPDPQAQPQYGQPVSGQPYGQPAHPVPGQGQQNNFGLIGMILGIAALPTSLCCAALGLVLGVVATILGVLGRKKADEGLATNRGQAQAALICGIIAIVLAVINIILALVLNVNYGYNFS